MGPGTNTASRIEVTFAPRERRPMDLIWRPVELMFASMNFSLRPFCPSSLNTCSDPTNSTKKLLTDILGTSRQKLCRRFTKFLKTFDTNYCL